MPDQTDDTHTCRHTQTDGHTDSDTHNMYTVYTHTDTHYTYKTHIYINSLRIYMYTNLQTLT